MSMYWLYAKLSLFWEHTKLVATGLQTTGWYFVATMCLIVLWLLFRCTYRILNSEWRKTSGFILRHLVYPHLIPRTPVTGASTRLEVAICTLYLTANVLLVLLPWQTRTEIGIRAANMSIINLVPLLCGPRLSIMGEILGFSHRANIGTHKWLGRMAIIQAGVHALIALLEGKKFQWTVTSTSGVAGASALALIFVLSLHLVNRDFYETFLVFHFLLTLVSLIAIWRHLYSAKVSAGRTFLQIGVCLWMFWTLVHWIFFAFRNLAWNRPFAEAVVILRPDGDSDKVSRSEMTVSRVLQVDIKVPRPWRVRAGQHIFVSIPSVGVLVGLRGHPFVITWWDRSQDGLTISLLMKPLSGFTSELKKHAGETLRAYIDGPFGKEHGFGEFGTVIMFATGIGIAGHLPYLKDLISGFNSCEVKTQRILLVWQIKKSTQESWIKHWIDELLARDTGYVRPPSHRGSFSDSGQILELSIYTGNTRKIDVERGSPSMVNTIFSEPNVEELLANEFSAGKGRIIVSVCAENKMSDKVRSKVQRSEDNRIRLVELDFKPSERRSRTPTRSGMEFMCRG